MTDYFDWLDREAAREEFDEWVAKRQRYIVIDESNLEVIEDGDDDTGKAG